MFHVSVIAPNATVVYCILFGGMNECLTTPQHKNKSDQWVHDEGGMRPTIVLPPM